KSGRTGLAQNRLAVSTIIEDVQGEDVDDLTAGANATWTAMGRAALADGRVAVLSLAAGVGSRWTQGAGVVKALHPFCKLGGKHRTFLEIHLAKSRKISRIAGTPIPHVFTTSYLTDQPIRDFLSRTKNYHYDGPVVLSRGKSVGLRLVPTT